MYAVRRILLPALFVVSLAVASAQAAPKAAPGVLPPNASAYGMTYTDWAAAWWAWGMSLSTYENPIFDTSLDAPFTLNGQSGRVIFLAGIAGSTTGPLERHITLPSGHPLFFPLVNFVSDNYAVEPPVTPEVLLEWTTWYANFIVPESLYATVDGVAVKHLDAFRFAGISQYYIPETDNWWLYFYPDMPDDAGVYDMAHDGYWLMLAPLPVGRHTITFGGEVLYPDGNGGRQDITYVIDVVPAGQFER